MKYGVLFCGYNSEQYVKSALEPWKKRGDCIISAVSVPFLEYVDIDDMCDGTTQYLETQFHNGLIDEVFTRPRYLREHEARNLALDALLGEDVDFIFIVDADEIYKDKEIDQICQYVEENPTWWYKIALKNFVFDKNHYLEEPFCPPRVFRVKADNLRLDKFYWDNDIQYKNIETGEILDYKSLPCLQVPKKLACIDHYTWLSDEIGKRKCAYQQSHFGHSMYKWNEKENRIEFDEVFLKQTGQEKPKVCKVS